MMVELKIPEVGESITEVEIGDWLKAEGEPVEPDQSVVIIESEKATMELPAPVRGVLRKILKTKGQTAAIGEVIGQIEKAEVLPEEIPPAEPYSEEGLQAPPWVPPPSSPVADRQEEAVPMSRLRRTVARRLVEAQQTAALLTTFNEIDMAALMTLRRECQPAFQQQYRTKLGIMSFFVKAAIDALRRVPPLNAAVRDTHIVYHNYYDIGVAIGSGKGLVVPVLRNAERMSFAEIEIAIADFAQRAKENKLKLEELQGGTFTISNGGIYGSLLSTPLVNPPQSGILGLHTIQDRPVVREGAVVIRPMMYVALTYDHRIVDGREAVTFLRRIKQVIENPARMLIEI